MIQLVVFVNYKDGTSESIEVKQCSYSNGSLNYLKEKFDVIDHVIRNLYLAKAFSGDIKDITGSIADITIEDDYEVLEQFSYTVRK